MSDIITATSKRLQDLSAPEELIQVYVSAPGGRYVKRYKTALTPLCLTSGKSADHGSDIRLTDQDGNTRPEWIGSYKTAIGDVEIWTRPIQYSPGVPHSFILTVGDAGHDIAGGLGGPLMSLFSAGNNDGESNKVLVNDLVKHTLNTITTPIQTKNWFVITAYGCWGTHDGGAWCPGMASSYSFLPGPDFIAYTIGNCAGKSIVVDSTGGLHLVYVSLDVMGFYNTAYHAYSVDGGKSWTTEIISLNADAPQANVGITIDSVDTLHFVWSEEELSGGVFGKGNEHIKYRNKTVVGVWSAVEVISRAELLGLSTICLPCIQVNHDSLTIGVVFSGVACVGGVYGQVIQYNERSAAGVWGGYENVGGLVRGAPSLDYDSSSVPHVCSMSYNNVTFVHDLMYTNKTGGVWAAPTLLVADVDVISNVVFDLLGQLHVCYVHGGDIYHIRMSAAGVWGAATLIDSITLNLISIQVDPYGNCQVVYVKNDEGCYKIVDNFLVVGDVVVWYSVAGNSVGSFAIPWSHYPVINDQFTQLSRNSNCFAFTAGAGAFPVTGDLLFTADDDSVIGGLSDPTPTIYVSQRQRGLIDQSSSQSIISPGLIS